MTTGKNDECISISLMWPKLILSSTALAPVASGSNTNNAEGVPGTDNNVIKTVVNSGVNLDVNVLKDTGLDLLLMKGLAGDGNIDISYNLTKYITKEPEVICYRLNVIDDLVKYPGIMTCFEEILPDIRELNDNINGTGRVSFMDKNLVDILGRLSELQLYSACIKKIYGVMNGYKGKFTSEGLKSLYKKVSEIAESDNFNIMTKELEALRNESKKLSSVTIGVNLNEQLKPVEAVLVSINNEKYNSGSLMDKLSNLDFKANKYTGISQLQVIDNTVTEGTGNNIIFRQAIINSLNNILKSIVKPVIPVIEKYVDVSAGFLAALHSDFAYYIGAIQFIGKFRGRGYPMCRPQVEVRGSRICEIDNVYNMTLAEKISNPADMVMNDIQFNDKARIFVLTGPNRGGKTTFVQAIGQAQVLFQLGLYVPGTRAQISPADGIFTHFPVEEGEAAGMGRLGEECKRMADIIYKLDRYSFVLMNESFSSTSPGEGIYIARDVILGLKFIGVRALFATHFHDLASDLDEMNKQTEGVSIIDSLVTGVKEKDDSSKAGNILTERTYKVRRIPPQGKSFAAEVADYYGISIEKITRKLADRGILPLEQES